MNIRPYFIDYASTKSASGSTPKASVHTQKPAISNDSVQTKKFPSDNESGNIPPSKCDGGNAQTLKFPSDNESGNIPPSTGGPGNAQTLKFPSDNESGNIPPSTGGPGNAQTLKFPSDNESGNIPPSTGGPGNAQGAAMQQVLDLLTQMLQMLSQLR